MGSSRLPGKPLLKIGGMSSLGFLISRLRSSQSLSQIVVATSELSENDILAAECVRLGVGCFRGSELDVLGRLAQAARSFKANIIVRITADDVLMDPAVVDFMVEHFQANVVDCATSLTTKSFPNGFVLSVFSMGALEKAERLAVDPFEREHVVPVFLTRMDSFRTLHVKAPPSWSGYNLGLTLDTVADYEFISDIVRHCGDQLGGIEDILALVARDSDLRQRAQKNGYYWETDRNGTVHRL